MRYLAERWGVATTSTTDNASANKMSPHNRPPVICSGDSRTAERQMEWPTGDYLIWPGAGQTGGA